MSYKQKIKQGIKDWYGTAILIILANAVLIIFIPYVKVDIITVVNSLVFVFICGITIGRWTLEHSKKIDKRLF